MKLTSLSLIFFVQISFVYSSHFRGSMLTWRVVNSTSNPLLVEILQRHAWNYTWWPCTNPQISAGNYMIGAGIIQCMSGCPPNISTIGTVSVPCTGYNQIERYVSGEGRLTFKVPPNYRFQAVFTASAWFSLVTGGGTWSVTTEINTFLRPNGRYNQAPIVTMLPVIRIRRFLTYFIKINVADNDFDRYTCIWSNASQECGGICRSALSLPVSTFLNETSCILRFTPVTAGFYAMAFTVLDFENETSTTPLSRVPIQFIFNVWDSNATCILAPIYIGDAPADQCIFVEPNQVLTMVIRIKIRCPNATLANIIAAYPSGFTQSSTYTDSYDSTINNFRVSYTANINQVGQNLFCFAGVDSIGNQGDSTCLRLTVQIGSDSRNTLYINNATRYPTGLVSKYQSNWTLLYPPGISFNRPATDAFVRFKVTSTNEDFVTYNVVIQTANVIYRSDRLEIISNVVFWSGEQYYILLDPGVFLPIATCLRDSMGITDTSFWTFRTVYETSTTSTTSAIPLTTTVTIQNRTVPTIRTLPSTLPPTTTTTQTTVPLTTTTSIPTTIKIITSPSPFLVSTGVAIGVGSLILITTIVLLIIFFIRRKRVKPVSKISDDKSETDSTLDTVPQYRLTTRNAAQMTSKIENIRPRDIAMLSTQTHHNLVDVNH